MADTDRLSPEEARDLEIDDPSPVARVRMRSVKLFTDGALVSWGAALLSPYSDRPDVRGIMRYTEGEFRNLIRGWWDRGWGVVYQGYLALLHWHTDVNLKEHPCHWRSCK